METKQEYEVMKERLGTYQTQAEEALVYFDE